MGRAYCIVMGCGEYSGRWERPVKVYLDKEKAQAVIRELESINDAAIEEQVGYFMTRNGLTRDDWLAKYRALYGALGYDADADHDWALEECELVE